VNKQIFRRAISGLLTGTTFFVPSTLARQQIADIDGWEC